MTKFVPTKDDSSPTPWRLFNGTDKLNNAIGMFGSTAGNQVLVQNVVFIMANYANIFPNYATNLANPTTGFIKVNKPGFWAGYARFHITGTLNANQLFFINLCNPLVSPFPSLENQCLRQQPYVYQFAGNTVLTITMWPNFVSQANANVLSWGLFAWDPYDAPPNFTVTTEYFLMVYLGPG